MIRVAGSTFAFGDTDLETSCDILKGLGFDTVDLGGSGWSTFTDYVPQQVVQHPNEPEREAARIQRILHDRDLQVSEFFICDFGKAINHPDSEERARSQSFFAQFAHIGQLVGCESIMMLPGNIHVELGQCYEDAFAISVEEYKRMVDVSQKHGLLLNFEPCIMSIAIQPDQAERLVDAVPGVGYTLDYAHQVQIGLTNEGIEPMHRHARHFHVKQSAEGEFEVKIDADNGAIDFGRMMGRLRRDNFDGVVTVEYVAAPDVVQAGWDMAEETGKLKEVIDTALK